jgi:hypothetical protein
MDTGSYGQNMTGFGQGYGEMDGQLLRNDDIFRA